MSKQLPILAITMGDPAGIGPEIAAKAFSRGKLHQVCRPLLIGHSGLMQQAIKIAGVKLQAITVNNVREADFKPGFIDVYELECQDFEKIRYGEISPIAGDLAFRAVKKAIDLAMAGEVDGTVTNPIHKGAINAAGHKFSGHTEIYAHLTNTPEYAMLLADSGLRVIHVSTHVSLRQACDMVKKERIIEVIVLLHNGLKKIGIEKPRIGVAGLNPHSSDGGLFGWEEEKEILPAVEEAVRRGINVEGPIPPDVLFALARGGKYDGCVAMYHDQGHIPFKVLGFKWDEKTGKMKSVKGVNITLGLPIIRTSVDHGTAFEIAGKGIASPDALLNAVDYAVKLHLNKF
ncbi:MAG: 4-hydroxythreonine-4-phosphate dehydrogenase PdxA [Prolixibacteraceae bacterium]|nr:4-hydroxythreonine-4-phosphate dehydrogenase PdxA [Prolixibacteraceae bacterium]